MSYHELQQAADQARDAYESRRAIDLYAAALAALRAAPDPTVEFELLSSQAACYHRLADYAAEEASLAALASLAAQLGDEARQLRAAVRQVELQTQLGNAGAGRALAEQALTRAWQLGDSALEAACLYVLGRALAVLGEHSQAQLCQEQALDRCRALGDRTGEANCLRELGWAATRFLSPAQGQRYLEHALDLYRALGDREGEGMALNELSLATGDYARQRAYLEQALAIFEAIGDRHKLSILANNLGLVYLLMGLYRQATSYCARAVQLARELNARSTLVFCLDTLAHAQLGLGDLAAARRTYMECRALAAATGKALEVAYAWLGLGRVALRAGSPAEARTQLDLAQAHLARLDAPGERATALAWLGAACLAQGDLAQADRYSAESCALLAAGMVSQDFPPQDVWWMRYRVLRARTGALTNTGAAAPASGSQIEAIDSAPACLARAHDLTLAGIASLSDAGLRRNYLNKVAINAAILEEHARLMLPAPSALPQAPDNLRDQLARMLAISVQMNELREEVPLRGFILDQLVELSGAERALLLLYGRDGAASPDLLASGVAPGAADALLAEAEPLIAAATRARHPALHLLDSEPAAASLDERSALCIPLVAGGQLAGLIYADSRALFGSFTPDDLDLLTVLGTQAATALENARLYSETLRANRELEQRVAERTVSLERRLAELATVNQIGQAVARQLELGDLIELVGETMRTTFDAQNVYVALYDAATELISFPYDLEHGQRVTGDVLRLGVGLTSEILLTGRPLLLNGEAEMREAGLRIASVGAPARSFLGVPISVGEQVIGVISVQNTQRDGAFSQDDARLLATVAASVGIAIANARLYDERRRMQQAAEAASVAKSTFLANMSHELRTPLNAVLGFAQVLTRDDALSARQREHLGIITRSGEHLLQLINNVLEMSKIEAGRVTLTPAPFDLRRMLEGVAELFMLRAEAKQLTLESTLNPNLPRAVVGDEGKLRQVLINLLGNAVKFTHKGRVALRVSAEQMLERGGQPAARVTFEVEDTGDGIAPEQLATLFQPFVQTDSGLRSHEGSGLGLAISRQFVQLMGGDIEVASELRRGSRFFFSLNLAAAAGAALGKEARERRVIGIAPADGHEQRVLVVDDKWENRRLLAEWLGRVGFAVREAADGQQALAIWERWGPQLIWMDLRMPVLDGYEATRRIKASLKGQATVVIALTASTFEQEQAVMLATGCDDFVRKPVREATIFEKMEQHLGLRLIYEQAGPAAADAEPEPPSAAMLQALPGELQAALRQAVDEIDAEAAAALVDEVRQHDPALAQSLGRLLDGYRFDMLQQLFDESKEQR